MPSLHHHHHQSQSSVLWLRCFSIGDENPTDATLRTSPPSLSSSSVRLRPHYTFTLDIIVITFIIIVTSFHHHHTFLVHATPSSSPPSHPHHQRESKSSRGSSHHQDVNFHHCGVFPIITKSSFSSLGLQLRRDAAITTVSNQHHRSILITLRHFHHNTFLITLAPPSPPRNLPPPPDTPLPPTHTPLSPTPS